VDAIHRLMLYTLLAMAAAGLVLPGVINISRSDGGHSDLVAKTADARNHLRGLNGMLAAIGIIALWAMIDIQRSRNLVMALGVVMAGVVLARLFSLIKDGAPAPITWFYLAVEAVMAVVFLGFPPPGNR